MQQLSQAIAQSFFAPCCSTAKACPIQEGLSPFRLLGPTSSWGCVCQCVSSRPDACGDSQRTDTWWFKRKTTRVETRLTSHPSQERALWPADKWHTRKCGNLFFCLPIPAWIILKGGRGWSQLAFSPPLPHLTSTDRKQNLRNAQSADTQVVQTDWEMKVMTQGAWNMALWELIL